MVLSQLQLTNYLSSISTLQNYTAGQLQFMRNQLSYPRTSTYNITLINQILHRVVTGPRGGPPPIH